MIQSASSTELNRFTVGYCGAMGFILMVAALWLCVHWFEAINVDVAFLSLSAGRLLNGVSMSAGYYDTNPPLSVLLYVPAVLISKLTPLPLYHAVTVYFVSLLLMFLFATNLLLKRLVEVSKDQRLLILAVFLLMNTVGVGYDFGQRDHILAMALFPFVLTQILMTRKTYIPIGLKWFVLCLGSVLILLKPHFGLIPAAIFIHRAIAQRRITVFKDPDFITLAVITLGYMAIISIFFNDFLTMILPDVIRYYAFNGAADIYKTGLSLFMRAFVPLVVCQVLLTKAPQFISTFFMIAILCIVPFVVQGKGWLYHAFPMQEFFYIGVVLLVFYGVTVLFSRIKDGNSIAFLIVMLALGGFCALNLGNHIEYSKRPSHDAFLHSELADMIQDCPEDPCAFFLFNDMINIAPELSVYTKQEHASRFPVLWFIPYLLNAQNRLDQGLEVVLTQKQINEATRKYTDMVVDDLKVYRPEILVIGQITYSLNKGDIFNFIDYMRAKNDDFKTVFEAYELERSIDIDRLDYMPAKFPNEGLIRYDIYRKKKLTREEERI